MLSAGILLLLALALGPSLQPVPREIAEGTGDRAHAYEQGAGSAQRTAQQAGTPIRQTPPTQPKQGAPSGVASDDEDQTQVVRVAPIDVKKDWTDYSLWIFNGLLALVAVLQTILLLSTMRSTKMAADAAKDNAIAARRSARIARRQLELAYRPTIRVFAELASGLTFDDQGNGRFAVRFTIHNFGNTPATDVVYDWNTVVPSMEGRDDVMECYNQVSAIVGALKSRPLTIDPARSIQVELTGPIDGQALREEYERYSHMPQVMFFPVIVGCVGYRFMFMPGQRQTGVILDLIHWKNGKYAPIEPLIDIGESALTLHPGRHIQPT